MKKSLLSALGLAFVLAISMPILGTSSADAAAKQAAPATTAATASAGSDAMAKKHMKTHVKACKVTKKHKCPMKHKKHMKMHSMAKKAY